MESKISRWCEGLIEAGWLAAVVVTPLFFNIHSSRVFEPDKLTLMRTIAVIMAAAWLIKFIDQKGWKSIGWLRWRSDNSIWRMPFVIPIALLVIVYLLATIFSTTRGVSWAGSYQRLQGTYTTLSYVVIFVLMIATMRTREQVSRVVTTIIIVSIPVALYAMLQHFDLDPLPWGGNVQRRVAGHMGNSIFIAAYLIMVIPLTLARIIDAFTNILNDEELSIADVTRSSIYIFTLAIQIIAIFWTRSRGPFIGLAVSIWAFVLIMLVTLRNAEADKARLKGGEIGKAVLLVIAATIVPLLLVAMVLQGTVSSLSTFAVFGGAVGLLIVAIFVMAVARRGWRWLWLTWILLAMVAAGLLGLFNVPEESAEPYLETPIVGDMLQTLASWRDLPEIGRFGELLEAGEGSGRVRILIWEGALDLLAPHEPLETPDGKEDPFNFLRPVIGYGPESMYVVYNRFYPPELATIEARNASPDRSHNETFDALVITGVAGFLAWQLVYLSVFYFGFKWLGVVRSKRDRNVMIVLWIGGAILGGLALTTILGLPYLGVAVPFGTIAGLVIYLIYYALFSSGGDEADNADPFSVDRLLMIALVAAVLAHYVEIHFGIAIAATRTHFFVYMALMFIVGYFLPRIKVTEQNDKGESKTKRRRRSGAKESESWVAPVLSSAFILALIIGILGFNFMTYSLPGGTTIQSIEQVPAAGEIFNQALFINAQKEFAESPFIFLMIVLVWALGVLLYLSEMAKHGLIKISAASSTLKSGRSRTAGILFILILAFTVANRFLFSEPASGGVNPLVGDILLLIWAALCVLAAIWLFQEHGQARLTAGIVALFGLSVSIPVVAAGGTLYGFFIAITCGVVLYLLWDRAWNDLLLPAAILVVTSLGIGLFYAYFQALQIRNGILPPPGATEATPALERRILEAGQAIGLLTAFYVFVFFILAVTGFVLAQPKIKQARHWATIGGLVAVILLIPTALYFVSTSNMRIIQADMVYKRGDPWDKQAGRTQNPELWDNAIAIYEHAIDLAPAEDFYYLWLGRAYLERSSVTEESEEQDTLLDTASDRLLRAQEINPLNTDHTANLARLNTRWAELSRGEDRKAKVDDATAYYESAISLSPHNAVILNEYARLAFILEDDCEKSLALYEQSAEVDPFFSRTLFDRAEIALACGDRQSEGEGKAYYEAAIESLVEGMKESSTNTRRWLQLANAYINIGEKEQALEVYERASAVAGANTPQWQIDFTMAQWFAAVGDLESAAEFAQSALQLAPAEDQEQIQRFLVGITTGSVEGDG